MKKLALALMAVAATLLGFGMAVQAYPPGAGVVTSKPAIVEPGGEFTATTTCQPREGVDMTFLTQTGADVCSTATGAGLGSALLAAPQVGTASVVFTAPMEPGTYFGNATGSSTGSLGPFSVTVRAAPATPNPLPTTGSSGTSTMTFMALGLFGIGAGLFGVARVRRPYLAA